MLNRVPCRHYRRMYRRISMKNLYEESASRQTRNRSGEALTEITSKQTPAPKLQVVAVFYGRVTGRVLPENLWRAKGGFSGISRMRWVWIRPPPKRGARLRFYWLSPQMSLLNLGQPPCRRQIAPGWQETGRNRQPHGAASRFAAGSSRQATGMQTAGESTCASWVKSGRQDGVFWRVSSRKIIPGSAGPHTGSPAIPNTPFPVYPFSPVTHKPSVTP
jgi:hypothetical protein